MDQIKALRDSVIGLQKEVAKLRRTFGRRTVALVVVGVALVVAVAIATHVQADNDRRLREANQRWCPLISLLIPRPGDPPAATARGRQIAVRATALAHDFDCTPLTGK